MLKVSGKEVRACSIKPIVSNPQMKHPFTFNQVNSMIIFHQIIRVFNRNGNRQNGQGNIADKRARDRERNREQQIRGEREAALVRNGLGVGQSGR